MRTKRMQRADTQRVHILRDGALRRGPGFCTTYSVSVITDGFQIPDEALRRICAYVQKIASESNTCPPKSADRR